MVKAVSEALDVPEPGWQVQSSALYMEEKS